MPNLLQILFGGGHDHSHRGVAVQMYRGTDDDDDEWNVYGGPKKKGNAKRPGTPPTTRAVARARADGSSPTRVGAAAGAGTQAARRQSGREKRLPTQKYAGRSFTDLIRETNMVDLFDNETDTVTQKRLELQFGENKLRLFRILNMNPESGLSKASYAFLRTKVLKDNNLNVGTLDKTHPGFVANGLAQLGDENVADLVNKLDKEERRAKREEGTVDPENLYQFTSTVAQGQDLDDGTQESTTANTTEERDTTDDGEKNGGGEEEEEEEEDDGGEEKGASPDASTKMTAAAAQAAAAVATSQTNDELVAAQTNDELVAAHAAVQRLEYELQQVNAAKRDCETERDRLKTEAAENAIAKSVYDELQETHNSLVESTEKLTQDLSEAKGRVAELERKLNNETIGCDARIATALEDKDAEIAKLASDLQRSANGNMIAHERQIQELNEQHLAASTAKEAEVEARVSELNEHHLAALKDKEAEVEARVRSEMETQHLDALQAKEAEVEARLEGDMKTQHLDALQAKEAEVEARVRSEMETQLAALERILTSLRMTPLEEGKIAAVINSVPDLTELLTDDMTPATQKVLELVAHHVTLSTQLKDVLGVLQTDNDRVRVLMENPTGIMSPENMTFVIQTFVHDTLVNYNTVTETLSQLTKGIEKKTINDPREELMKLLKDNNSVLQSFDANDLLMKAGDTTMYVHPLVPQLVQTLITRMKRSREAFASYENIWSENPKSKIHSIEEKTDSNRKAVLLTEEELEQIEKMKRGFI